ncbi:hypothetical protein BBP40_004828 [Aspergillus hancockii]|nr:hypothetical protein BBP40_004828 [Aspergillus hancockii]
MSPFGSSVDLRSESFSATGGALDNEHVSQTDIDRHDEDEREPLFNDPDPAERRPAPGINRILSNLWHRTRQSLMSEDGIGVFKCSLAYLLGSLATFIPAVAAFLGPLEGKHIVATITVYFHPARSKGSMYKALIYAFLAFLYAAFISLTSMYVTIFFQRLRMIEVGHILVLVVFVGVGFGFIGWTKQKMGDALVNVACSLASLTSIIVLTKEGAIQRGDISLDKVFQVLKMLLMGIGVTMAVSFLVCPVSARKQLRSNLITQTRTMALIQSMVTESFLQRAEPSLQGPEFTAASARLKNAQKQLTALLYETKFELYIEGKEKDHTYEERLVGWARDMSHNLGALVSSAFLAFETLKRPLTTDQRFVTEDSSFLPAPISGQDTRLASDALYSQQSDVTAFAGITQGNGRTVRSAQLLSTIGEQTTPDDVFVTELFDSFVKHIGPSMRSLVVTLVNTFEEVPFGLAPGNPSSVDPRSYMVLGQAIEKYQQAQNEAFALLYREQEESDIHATTHEACFHEIAAICAHFSHLLLKTSEQLRQLLLVLGDLEAATHGQPEERSWKWVQVWRRGHARGYSPNAESSSEYPLMEVDAAHSMEILEPFALESQSTIRSIRETISHRIRKFVDFFRKDETKFAVKVGTGALLYALPSFLSFTRSFYLYWKGEWGLISYMLVCSMTIGASNTTGYARFLGTCIGALCSIGAWFVIGSSAVGLALFGFLMAAWTFYISLLKGQGPLGRFIMLTYNLSVLYAYSLSQSHPDDNLGKGSDQNPDITKITLHRVGAVLSGCIWGIIITRGIWPISARKKLKTTLQLVFLRLARIWESDPLANRITTPGTPALYMTPNEQLKMGSLLSELESLRAAARYEFELSAPFPDAAYGNVIQHTQAIVDALHAFDLQLLSIAPSERELQILRHTSTERQKLSAHISHLLKFIIPSITLAHPPNDIDITNAKDARDQLLSKILVQRKADETSRSILEEGYSLPYAYTLVTGQILNKLAEVMVDARRLSVNVDEDRVDRCKCSGELIMSYDTRCILSDHGAATFILVDRSGYSSGTE